MTELLVIAVVASAFAALAFFVPGLLVALFGILAAASLVAAVVWAVLGAARGGA